MVSSKGCHLTKSSKNLPFAEFITLLALMISLVALSIDAMLPALPEIGQALGVQRANDSQLVVSVLFLGLALGQLIYGPLSDSIGRKPPIYLGFAVFIAGCLLSLFATSYPVMLGGRLLQGLGVAGPRSVSLALVRDLFEGDAMAKVMSYIMTVFILVPMIAPAYGQAIVTLASWRAIFTSLIVLATFSGLWFALRQRETLELDKRRPFTPQRLGTALKEIFSHKTAFGYTLAAGFISGAFLGYLNSAQQLFQEHYSLGARFPLYFAIIAVALGAASFLNGQLVMRYGMKRLATTAVTVLTGLSSLALVIALVQAGKPPLWQFMAYLLAAFFCVGILFGNLNALAMQPLGHIAGVGAAVVGSLSTLISVPLGIGIGQSYNDTVLPLVAGLAILAALCLLVMRWADPAA